MLLIMTYAVKAVFDRVKTDFPAGTTTTGYVLTMTETTTGAVVQGYGSVEDGVVRIDDLPMGTYRSTLALMGGDGQPLAPPVTDPVDYVQSRGEGATVRLAVPVSLSVVADDPAPVATPPAPDGSVGGTDATSGVASAATPAATPAAGDSTVVVATDPAAPAAGTPVGPG